MSSLTVDYHVGGINSTPCVLIRKTSTTQNENRFGVFQAAPAEGFRPNFNPLTVIELGVFDALVISGLCVPDFSPARSGILGTSVANIKQRFSPIIAGFSLQVITSDYVRERSDQAKVELRENGVPQPATAMHGNNPPTRCPILDLPTEILTKIVTLCLAPEGTTHLFTNYGRNNLPINATHQEITILSHDNNYNLVDPFGLSRVCKQIGEIVLSVVDGRNDIFWPAAKFAGEGEGYILPTLPLDNPHPQQWSLQRLHWTKMSALIEHVFCKIAPEDCMVCQETALCSSSPLLKYFKFTGRLNVALLKNISLKVDFTRCSLKHGNLARDFGSLHPRLFMNSFDEVPVLAVIIGEVCPMLETINLILSGVDVLFNAVSRLNQGLKYSGATLRRQRAIEEILHCFRMFVPGVKLVLGAEIGGVKDWGVGENGVGERELSQKEKEIREQWRVSYLWCAKKGIAPATWLGLKRGKGSETVKEGEDEYIRECL